MKRLFMIIFFASLCLSNFAQHKSKHSGRNFPQWSAGVIVLQSGDSVKCHLRYSRMTPEGLLQVRENDNVLTLTAKEVKAFSYFDEHKNCIRKFYTFTLLPDPSAPSREFFLESVYGNKRFSILNHKTIGFAYEYMEYTPFKRSGPVNKKYVLDMSSGKLVPMSKENTLQLLHEKETEIRTYIASQGLKFKSVSDYISVFEYHNSL